MNDPKHDIKFLVSHASDDMELCEAVLQIISKSSRKEQSPLLEMFFVYSAQLLRDYIMRLRGELCKEEEWRYQKTCKDSVNRFLTELVAEDLPTGSFYDALWRYISDNSLFPTSESKVAVLFCCLKSCVLPYFYLNVDTNAPMDKEIRILSNSSSERSIAKLEYILGTSKITTVQKALYLARISRRKKRLAERASLMLDIINYYESQIEVWDYTDFFEVETEEEKT